MLLLALRTEFQNPGYLDNSAASALATDDPQAVIPAACTHELTDTGSFCMTGTLGANANATIACLPHLLRVGRCVYL